MFIVEGTIGAGKSTFLSLLQQHLPFIKITLEPTSWRDGEQGQSLLAQFYDNPQRWAYMLETFAMACRAKEYLQHTPNNSLYHLAERSIYSGHYIFAYNSYKQGFLSGLEWHLYTQWFQLWTQSCRAPRGFIYLRVSPDIAYERIKKRNREAEEKISFHYLTQLHHHHEQLLMERNNQPEWLAKVPVLVLDGDREFEQDEGMLESHAQLVEDFILQYQPCSASAPATPLAEDLTLGYTLAESY